MSAPGPFWDGDLLSPLGALKHFERYREPLEVSPTPFPTLNESCRGFGARKGLALGWYVVIGGDTGQGKSLLAMQLAVEASRAGWRVGFASLEMSMHELRNRFFTQVLGIEARRLEPGDFYDPAVEDEVRQGLEGINAQAPGQCWMAADDLDPDVDAVLAQMEHWRTEYGCRVFVIDYLQLCESVDAVGIAAEVQKISKAARDYAHRNRVLVIGLSQYNNEGGNDRSRPPHVGHLYGGRRISQDSDITLLLDHSRYEQDGAFPWIARSYIMVPKNRNGPNGHEIPIEWDYRHLLARQPDKIEEGIWPTREK